VYIYPRTEGTIKSGTSSWVSTIHEDSNGKDWIQTGWRIKHDFSPFVPWKYWEWCINFGGPDEYCFYDYWIDYHHWGTSEDYMVMWKSSVSKWCAYIHDYEVVCRNVHSTPAIMLAKSEIHLSPSNELDTKFYDVRYMDSGSVFRYFDQYRFSNDLPYLVDVYYNYYYRTYLGNTIYIPVVYKNY